MHVHQRRHRTARPHLLSNNALNQHTAAVPKRCDKPPALVSGHSDSLKPRGAGVHTSCQQVCKTQLDGGGHVEATGTSAAFAHRWCVLQLALALSKAAPLKRMCANLIAGSFRCLSIFCNASELHQGTRIVQCCASASAKPWRCSKLGCGVWRVWRMHG